MCATTWIKHLGIAIVASSKGCSMIKHGDWFMLVSKGTNDKWTSDLMDQLMTN
jgi:hypothetical protein